MIKLLSYTTLIVITVDILALSGDLAMTWTSPILPKLLQNNPEINPLPEAITKEEESWIGALINFGAMLGPFIFTSMADRLGRKYSILLMSLPIIISFLLLAFCKMIALFYFARFLAGITIGGGCALLPMYIAEISEDSNRGFYSTTINIFWTLGNLIPYCLGPYLPYLWFNIILAIIPITFLIAFLLIGYETPYYLIRNGKLDEAESVLIRLRSRRRSQIQKDMEHIKRWLESDSNVSILDLVKTKTNIKALSICMLLLVFQQLSGITAIVFYTQLIFEAAGAQNLSAELSSLIFGLVFFISSVITPIFAERLGRRIFLLGSAFGMICSLTVFGTYFYLLTINFNLESVSWIPIVSLVIYIISYNFGFAAVPWTLISELFPSSVKAIASSSVSAGGWIMSFVVTKFFGDLNGVLGVGGTFWLFAGFCVVASVFIYFFVPETKGKSFKEIQELLGN